MTKIHVVAIISWILGVMVGLQANEEKLKSCTKDLTYELLRDNINYDCTTDRDCEMKTGRPYHH